LFWVMVMVLLGGSDYATRAWNRPTEIPAVTSER